ncbi:MAG TPA: hypothetical protein VIH48_02215 [Candidatus Bathyarchaeia archaeon]
MLNLTKSIMKYATGYALLLGASVFLGALDESLAYTLFFISSVLFSAAIIYELWRVSGFLKEIRYPIHHEDFDQKELEQLTRSIRKTLSGRSLSPYVASRLQRILMHKISLRSGMKLTEAENLFKNPEKLSALGYDRLASLITERSVLPRKKSEKIKALNNIFNQLEETN